MENINYNIPVVRHLDDIDDLEKFGRDGELIPGQEEKANVFAKEIYEAAKKEGRNAILFLSTDARRGVQTAELTSQKIKGLNENMKVKISTDHRLSSLYEGEFILPGG